MRILFIIYSLSIAAIFASAKDIQTLVVTTSPQMHCENCEAKIKGNLRFEKGIKKIVTDREKQSVTIEYDADKTTPENLIAGFKKIGYDATLLSDKNAKPRCKDNDKKDCRKDHKE